MGRRPVRGAVVGMALAVALGLSGCEPEQEEPSDGTAAAPGAALDTPTDAAPGDGGTTGGSGQGAPTGGESAQDGPGPVGGRDVPDAPEGASVGGPPEPGTPAELPSPAAADFAYREAILNQYRRHIDEMYGQSDLPRIWPEEWHWPHEAWPAILDCMVEAGQAESGGSADPTGTVSLEEMGLWDLAYYTCFSLHPAIYLESREFTPEQVQELYRYRSEKVVPCLEGLGYGPFDIPLLESRELGFPAWDPVNEIAMTTPEEFWEVQGTCSDRAFVLWMLERDSAG